ncbi:MAG: inorganic pyrophosphatase [Planctomycetes bacterium]|nr:inorganic pyrophosphatase [Planctomycetota bacterium]
MSPKTSFSTWRPHPWHGLSAGSEPPRRLTAYIEITPHDLVKYEIDKETGYLRLDRPQRTSALPPSLYGFVPRTYSGKRVARLMDGAEKGDGDPLDICVLCERPVTRAEILVETRIVGGLPMLDGGEADDKLIAVIESDNVWGHISDIGGVPRALLDRIIHYFATYKFLPDAKNKVEVGEPYDRAHAERVVRASMEDYEEVFGPVERSAHAGVKP